MLIYYLGMNGSLLTLQQEQRLCINPKDEDLADAEDSSIKVPTMMTTQI